MDRTCYLCYKQFDFPCDLKRHQNSKGKCNQRATKKCNICNKEYSSTSNYQAHKRKFHTLNIKEYVEVKETNPINTWINNLESNNKNILLEKVFTTWTNATVAECKFNISDYFEKEDSEILDEFTKIKITSK